MRFIRVIKAITTDPTSCGERVTHTNYGIPEDYFKVSKTIRIYFDKDDQLMVEAKTLGAKMWLPTNITITDALADDWVIRAILPERWVKNEIRRST